MKKAITTITALAGAAIAGIVVRQIAQDLSNNADLWRSVTDEYEPESSTAH